MQTGPDEDSDTDGRPESFAGSRAVDSWRGRKGGEASLVAASDVGGLKEAEGACCAFIGAEEEAVDSEATRAEVVLL